MEDLTAQMATTDAGAVPFTPVAGQESIQESQPTGAVPFTQSAEIEGGEGAGTPTGQEAQGATEGEKNISKPFEVRVNEVVEAKTRDLETKLQEMESRLAEREQAQALERPNFVEVDYDRLNGYLKKMVARETAIREDIALDPDNASSDLLNELFQIQGEREQIIREIRENERNRADYVKRQQTTAQNQAYHQQMQSRINDALTLLKDQERIPDDAFQAGRQFFINACKSNPFLQRQFDEKVMIGGAASAVLFAWEHVKNNMGKKQEALIQQKEEAKQMLPPGKTSTGEVIGNPELDALRKRAETSGNAEDLAAYSAAKRRLASAN